ncbi:CoA-binding protein [Magnetospirillum sp. UT-4]|uniref:succinate--CoA ligase subunit alpha n=1 Tax=Magnetospirillum sp. UT-4 TaxID=2681467 RepID=UPI0013832AAE|nr:CoA-binding protein [Magnetospirillum sp. UT-4]CAA7614354.1 succinyl-CoA synthetase, NAD(P)-binding, alpha subunit [Magnetospirillum sp. UT-4]
MILHGSDRVLVQGITGKQGTFWTEQMQAYGTNVVGGVNPKRAGEIHCNVPVFATAEEAAEVEPVDVAVMFIPPAAALAAAEDACRAGVRTLIILTEHIPSHDVMRIHAAARESGTRIVGPNTAGLVTPGECFVGIMPAFNDRVFKPGRVGVISRSGSLGTLVCLNLVAEGMGESAFIGIGGDPMVGTTSRDALAAFEADANTDAVVLVGEIGGAMEEEAAAFAATMTKPVVSFIAGAASPPGKKMGHAGAIVMGNRGSYASKRAALEEAGVVVADTPAGIVEALRQGGRTVH